MNYISEIFRLNKIIKNSNNNLNDENNLNKRIKYYKSKILSFLKNFILIILGVFAATIGFQGFLVPNNFMDGGATAISLLIHNLSGIPFGILLMIISSPFLLIGFFKLNLKLVIRSIFSISLLSILVQIIDFPLITQDKFLIAIFGGLFLGIGSGFAIRGGAVIDATEILALVITKNINISVGDFILVFNFFVFVSIAILLSIETSMYAALTYLVAAKTIDFILDGIEEYTEVTIISDNSEEIRKAISEELGKGVTIFKGQGGFSYDKSKLKDKDILYSVVTRLEISTITSIIDAIDPKAFVITNSVKDIRGGLVKTKKHHKHLN